MLTLDHLIPWSAGGTNEAENIVSSCSRCNSSRGARDWKVFVKAVAQYLNRGVTAKQIIVHIEETRRRPLDIAAAKEMIARRGSFAAVLQAARERSEMK